MSNAREQAVAGVFFALGDGTRLSVVRRLGTGGALSATALTDGAKVTRQAIVKHLQVLEGPFAPGKAIKGTFSRTLDEAALVEHQKRLGIRPSKVKLPGKDAVFCTVERVEPERYFSFRWIPYGIDADADPDDEPTTLVEFVLEPVAEGTLLTIVESGFDRVPAHRRERAFRMNEGGWAGQAENIRKYVEGA